MDPAAAVHVGQGGADLLEDRLAMLLDEVHLLVRHTGLHAARREVFHDEPMVLRILVRRDRDDLDDVGMDQLRADLRLVEQQMFLFRVARRLRQQQLHGEVAAALRLDHLPDLAALARRQAVAQFVSTDVVVAFHGSSPNRSQEPGVRSQEQRRETIPFG